MIVAQKVLSLTQKISESHECPGNVYLFHLVLRRQHSGVGATADSVLIPKIVKNVQI